VSWPPQIGEPLPRADEAFGIEDKLASYCLNPEHEIGGPKAERFERVLGIGPTDVEYLGIGPTDVEYLAEALRTGILAAPVTAVRDNAPFGVLCEAKIPVGGLGERRDRIATVTTAWELRHAGDRPRLVTAYIDG
jgi:hypothetical protein